MMTTLDPELNRGGRGWRSSRWLKVVAGFGAAIVVERVFAFTAVFAAIPIEFSWLLSIFSGVILVALRRTRWFGIGYLVVSILIALFFVWLFVQLGTEHDRVWPEINGSNLVLRF